MRVVPHSIILSACGAEGREGLANVISIHNRGRVCKRLANALHIHAGKAVQATGRGRTVVCAACSAQDLPHSHRFRLLDDLGRSTTRSVR